MCATFNGLDLRLFTLANSSRSKQNADESSASPTIGQIYKKKSNDEYYCPEKDWPSKKKKKKNKHIYNWMECLN